MCFTNRNILIKLKIPVNKTEELVFVSNDGMVNIEKYEGDQRIEIPLKEIPKFVDALLFIEHQENKFKLNASGSNKGVLFSNVSSS